MDNLLSAYRLLIRFLEWNGRWRSVHGIRGCGGYGNYLCEWNHYCKLMKSIYGPKGLVYATKDVGSGPMWLLEDRRVNYWCR